MTLHCILLRGRKKLPRRRRAGFTLVETVIALGIVAFAMIGILGMVPVGLSNFRQAMDNTAESQIIQALSNDLLLAKHSELEAAYGTGATNYYSDEGRLLKSPEGAIFEVKFMFGDLQVPTVDATAGQTVRIEIKKLNSAQAARKYSLILPKE